jgi:hypothetical protein
MPVRTVVVGFHLQGKREVGFMVGSTPPRRTAIDHFLLLTEDHS